MKIIKYFVKTFELIKFYLGISMYNTDMELLKAPELDVNEKDKKIQRKRHRNQLLEKFYQGQRDEKYQKEYYELLKKSDEYQKKADARRMDLTADKWGMSYGRKDVLGRRTYEHLGYFDPSHKNYGKTLGEVLNTEIEERRVKDDEYELEYIIDNRKVELNLTQSFDIHNEKKGVDHNKRPVIVNRDNPEQLNKIEDVTDFIHVKKIGFEHRYFEFFIPKKFKLYEHDENSTIFEEMILLNDFWYRDKYGELYGFKISEYVRRIDFNQEYEIIKFKGIEIENVK
jgi:hypothetical protein